MVNGKERLPMDEHAPERECIAAQTTHSYCQNAGDMRVNEQPGLGSIHLLFHLYHNHIVRRLSRGILQQRGEPYSDSHVEAFIRDAPEYLSEKLFQEARKILGAVMQKILYCDVLPIILGPRLIQKFKLGCRYRNQYNRYVDPRIANSFLTAAYRFGHSLIPNKMMVNYQMHDLKDMFMLPDNSLLYYESILEGLVSSGQHEGYDEFISKSVSEHLFESAKGKMDALDLPALNIQRGRDHGIPSYYHWRRYYNLRPVYKATDIGKNADVLKQVYKHYRDVELFPAGLLENPVPGGMVGETFGHILANQFADIKYGDRHFFLAKQLPEGFTYDQLEAIKELSISSLLCTVGYMTSVQENPFYLTTDKNPQVPCSQIPDLNVQPWLFYFKN